MIVVTRRERDGDPWVVALSPRSRRTTTSSPPGAEVIHRVVDSADGCRCWRCGTPFAWTTPEALARCTALAQAAATDSPVHYADAEVTEGWPGDDPAAALAWLHQRTARRGEPR